MLYSSADCRHHFSSSMRVPPMFFRFNSTCQLPGSFLSFLNQRCATRLSRKHTASRAGIFIGVLILLGGTTDLRAQDLPSWAEPSNSANPYAERGGQPVRGRLDRSGTNVTNSGNRFENGFGGQPTTHATCMPPCGEGEYCGTKGNSGKTKCFKDGSGPGDENGNRGTTEVPISGWIWLAAAGLGYGGYRLKEEKTN